MTQLELREALARRVREAMMSAEVTDAALARATGIPRPTLRRKVAGERDFAFTELALVAVALGIPSGELFSLATPTQAVAS